MSRSVFRFAVVFSCSLFLQLLPAFADRAPVPPNIVSWWPGEDMPLDIAGGKNAQQLGLVGLGEEQYTPGRVGRAFLFDGTDDMLSVDEDDKHDITGDLTIEAWINVSSAGSGTRTIIQKRSADGQSICYWLGVNGAGKLAFASTPGGSRVDVNTVDVLPVDQDVHVAITLLAGNLKMFINGIKTAEIFYGTGRPATDEGVTIGGQFGVPKNLFRGTIDELSLYSRALGNDEIAGIHAAGILGKERYDAAGNFEAWVPADTTQEGVWRYGEVQPESVAGDKPPVSTFTELTSGTFANGLGSWLGTQPLRITGNVSGESIVQPEGGSNIHFAPGAVTMRPGDNGRYAALKWTAPAAGTYAFSILFGGADDKPTHTYVRVLFEGALGVLTVIPKSDLQGNYFDGTGNTVSHWATLPLEAGEKLYFLVGDGANTDASFDSTAVFANIVPLEVLGGGKPTVTTGSATNIMATAATLDGTVNPNGSATTYHFEYGTSAGYGQSTPNAAAGNGTAPINVHADLSNLTPNTLYHFRLVAENGSGVTEGGDATFTTTENDVPFTVRLAGIQNGQVVRPKKIKIDAVIDPPNAGGATIASVQFFVDDVARPPLTETPYQLQITLTEPGERIFKAVATDTLGRVAISEPVHVTVSDSFAGTLALQVFVTPQNQQVAPGGSITYLLVATNASERKLTKVTLQAPIPDKTTLESANFVDANNQPVDIPTPKGTKNPAISEDRSSVKFSFGTFGPKETKRARLKVRVPYDVHEGDEPIVNEAFAVRGQLLPAGSIGQAIIFTGKFVTKTVEIIGSAPTNAPRLALAKGIVDLAEDNTDNTDFSATTDGALALTTYGDRVTFLLVATNTGELPASRVSVSDRIPRGFEYDQGSATVNGQKAGPRLKVNGRNMNFTFGDFAPGESLVMSYQLKVQAKSAGGPAVGEIVDTAPAEMHSANLSRGVDSAPERLSILILPRTTAVIDQPKALPEQAVVNGVQTYFIPYRNPSKREARNVRIQQAIPNLTSFRDAFLATAPAQKFPVGPDGVVIFDVGTVPPGAGGTAVLEVTVQSGVRDQPEPLVVLPPPVLLANATGAQNDAAGDAAAGTAPAQDVGPLFALYDERNVIRDPNLPKVGIWKIMPMSVREGETFACLFTAINYTAAPVESMQFRIEIPDGTEFVRADQGIDNSGNVGTLGDGFFVENFNHLTPHETHTVRVFLRATASIGSRIIEKSARVINFIVTPGSAPRALAKASATLVIRGDASEPDNQVAIARAQLSLENNDGAQAMADPKFLERTRNINANSRYFFINGVDQLQLNNGGAIVPTGAGRMVAAGAGNLIGNDGGTIQNKGGATLVGNDGGTIVLSGPASEIIFNLVGNDGASLVGNDGGTLLNQIYTGDSANMVAAGAGNMVAAGAGNLVASLVGNDGGTISQLVGNDGGTFFPITALVSSVRAAGGDLFAVGLGAFIPSADAIVSNGESYMVAAGAGNLVAAGGGNLISNVSEAFISADPTSVATLGLDGSLVIGGGLISDNGAIITQAPPKDADAEATESER